MNYNQLMEFEWDSDKIDACLAARGFDFLYAAHVFADPKRMVVKDQRWDYGEDRFQLLGKVDQRLLFVAYTVRRSAIRIISARKANQREVKVYENSTHEA